ncbi:hypothetical protein XELAEV_18025854mg [Xenopus laevis]|uniref:Uncharacterized protein n=1 Tax=Xenopus laevis TaxID=8355 RepID=A0A974HMG8_XENLA|nr:hypothetical protein XELAEV_18025854mg [Xenopus laevis]
MLIKSTKTSNISSRSANSTSALRPGLLWLILKCPTGLCCKSLLEVKVLINQSNEPAVAIQRLWLGGGTECQSTMFNPVTCE